MSKGFLYTVAAIFGVVFVSLFVFSQPAYSAPILGFLAYIFIPTTLIVVLINTFKNKLQNSEYSVLSILTNVLRVVIVGSILIPIVIVLPDVDSFVPLKFVGDGYAALIPIGTFFIVTMPSLIAYIILYLIKAAKSKN